MLSPLSRPCPCPSVGRRSQRRGPEAAARTSSRGGRGGALRRHAQRRARPPASLPQCHQTVTMSFTFVDNYCHGLITAEEALYPGSPALGQFYIVTDDGYELFWEALDRALCYLGGEKFTHLQTLLR